ncbi:MAG TPA: nucleotidyltransferase family protein [Xanthobacteraceae bacterium]|nr:nucleotidyltransferase family protein [Xanthobacteraceae bacterium]
MNAAILILAAGHGTRLPQANKLTADLCGEPVVRRVARAALASQLRPVLVVTGFAAEEVQGALAGLDVGFIHNPDHAAGLSTSLRAGLAALPGAAEAVAVLLGDMPLVEAALIDQLAQAALSVPGGAIAAPMRAGQRGNPLVWPRRFFAALESLSGDAGARSVADSHAGEIVAVPVEDEAAFTDIDTPDGLELVRLHLLAESADIDASEALESMRAEDA